MWKKIRRGQEPIYASVQLHIVACSLHASENQARRLINQEKSEYMNVEDYLRGLGYFLAEGIAEKALCYN